MMKNKSTVADIHGHVVGGFQSPNLFIGFDNFALASLIVVAVC